MSLEPVVNAPIAKAVNVLNLENIRYVILNYKYFRSQTPIAKSPQKCERADLLHELPYRTPYVLDLVLRTAAYRP